MQPKVARYFYVCTASVVAWKQERYTQLLLKKKAYSDVHLILWSKMTNHSNVKFQHGFPKGTTIDRLFPYVNPHSGKSWRDVFVKKHYERYARHGEGVVVRDYWQFTANKMDEVKTAFYEHHKHLPSIEDMVLVTTNNNYYLFVR